MCICVYICGVMYLFKSNDSNAVDPCGSHNFPCGAWHLLSHGFGESKHLIVACSGLKNVTFCNLHWKIRDFATMKCRHHLVNYIYLSIYLSIYLVQRIHIPEFLNPVGKMETALCFFICAAGCGLVAVASPGPAPSPGALGATRPPGRTDWEPMAVKIHKETCRKFKDPTNSSYHVVQK